MTETPAAADAGPLVDVVAPHGVLLAVGGPDLVVLWASANTGAHLGRASAAVLGAPLREVVGEPAVRLLAARLADEGSSGGDPLVLHPPGGSAYDVTWHRTDGMVVVELEPVGTAERGSASQLLADLRHAMDAFESSESLATLCDRAAGEVRRLTGFHRVSVQRLGCRDPAHVDLRMVPDAAAEPVPLLAAPGVAHGPPDLRRSRLGGGSPGELESLRSSGAGASLTIPLVQGTQLWGQLVCHHDSPRTVDARLRAACRLLGQVFSLQVVALEERERSALRSRLAEVEAQLLARMAGAPSLAEALVGTMPSALELTGAEGMLARIDGRTVSVGSVPPAAAVQALLARLGAQDEPGPLVCDDVPDRFVELAAFAQQASGVLALPLTAGYQDFIVWFRGESVVDRDPGGAGSVVPRQRTATPAPGHCRPWAAAEVDTARSLARALPELLLARARDHLTQLALHDPLTWLPNRTLLLDRGSQALARRGRHGGEVVMLFVDLDGFKLVNDSLGHAAGDDLLRQAALRLQAVTREADTVARVGGDEFAVLCEGSSLDVAQCLSERVVRSFQKPFTLGGQEARVTTSVGLAVADATTTIGDLLRDADTAMYQAKHSGRNISAPFTGQMRRASLRRVEIETHLRPALEGGDLELHFQPIHDSVGTLKGFEGLARWPLAGRGMVPPTEFIPVAEATGMIGPLTDWALEVGLLSLARWRAARPDLALTLAVNIAASQMGNEDLQHTIDQALLHNGLPADALCLEITESALVTDDPRNRAFLERLREQGVLLSIDDFGTGYSSLSYLTVLPVHELKVDRSFVRGLPTHARDMAVVASVVGLAHQLGLRALAEGVESQEQLAAVTSLGCDAIQGYLLGRPMPAQDVDRYLEQQQS